MPAPRIIHELVERFERNVDTYRSGNYNETQLRRDFLDPFFKALGWDIDNTDGYAEAYRDVIHEDAIRIGGSTKAPDYSFRIGGRRIFFLEEALRLHQGGNCPGLSAAALRLVGQPGTFDSFRFRGIRGL